MSASAWNRPSSACSSASARRRRRRPAAARSRWTGRDEQAVADRRDQRGGREIADVVREPDELAVLVLQALGQEPHSGSTSVTSIQPISRRCRRASAGRRGRAGGASPATAAADGQRHRHGSCGARGNTRRRSAGSVMGISLPSAIARSRTTLMEKSASSAGFAPSIESPTRQNEPRNSTSATRALKVLGDRKRRCAPRRPRAGSPP